MIGRSPRDAVTIPLDWACKECGGETQKPSGVTARQPPRRWAGSSQDRAGIRSIYICTRDFSPRLHVRSSTTHLPGGRVNREDGGVHIGDVARVIGCSNRGSLAAASSLALRRKPEPLMYNTSILMCCTSGNRSRR